MREWWRLGVASGTLFVTVVACGPVSPSRRHGEMIPGGELLPPARLSAPTIEQCADLEVITLAKQAPVADDYAGLDALSARFYGKYEVVNFAVQAVKRPGPDQFASFTWDVDRRSGSQRNCSRLQNLPRGYEHSLEVNAPGVLHLPSLRVTVFDENSSHDSPTFNYPAWRLFTVSATRYASEIDPVRMGSVPYVFNRSAGDHWNELIPAQPGTTVRIQPRPHGADGFQLLLQFETATETGAALITYSRAD